MAPSYTRCLTGRRDRYKTEPVPAVRAFVLLLLVSVLGVWVSDAPGYRPSPVRHSVSAVTGAAAGSPLASRFRWHPQPVTTTTVQVVPARVSRSRLVSQPRPLGDLLERIPWCESKNRYDALNAHSSASGRWQFLDSTWRSWQARYGDGRVFERAYLAPPEYQDLVAHRGIAVQGVSSWNASRHCWA